MNLGWSLKRRTHPLCVMLFIAFSLLCEYSIAQASLLPNLQNTDNDDWARMSILESTVGTVPEGADSCVLFQKAEEEFLKAYDLGKKELANDLSDMLFGLSQNCSGFSIRDRFWQVVYLKNQKDTAFYALNESCFSQAKVKADSAGMMRAIVMRGQIHYLKTQYALAAEVYSSTIPWFRRRKNYPQLCERLLSLSIIYNILGRFEKTAEVGYEGLKYIEEADEGTLNKVDFRAKFQLNISFALINMGNLQEALELVNQAISGFESLPNSPELLAAVRQKGGIYAMMENAQDSAMFYIEVAMHLIDTTDVKGKVEYSKTSFTLAFLYFDLKQYQQALSKVKVSLRLNKVIGTESSYYSSLALYGHILTFTDPDNSEAILLEAYEYFKSVSRFDMLAGIAHYLAIYHVRDGDDDEVLGYFGKFSAWKDSMFTKEKFQALKEAEVKYDTEQKEVQLVQNKEALAQSKELVTAQQKYLWAIGLGLGLAVILGLLALIAFSQKRKANHVLELQKQEIEKQNEEKALLLKEIHHRVKNNLQVVSSLLEMQIRGLSDPNAIKAVREGQNRIASISLIHQKLYQTTDLNRIKFETYAQQLLDDLSRTLTTDKIIRNHVVAGDIALDIDTIVPLGLILNELISNSYKHANEKEGEGLISVSLEAVDDGQFQLTFEDNGPGMPENFDISRSKTLGMQLVQGLTRQLQGSLEVYNDLGSVFKIHFKEKPG